MSIWIPPVIITKEIGITLTDIPTKPNHVELNLEGLLNTDVPTVSTSWSGISIGVPSKPNLSVNTPAEQNPGALPTEVTYTKPLVPDVSPVYFTDEYEDTHNSVVIPTPPNVNVVVFAKDIPSFSLDPANKTLDWAYDTYASDLLTILKDRIDELLTDPLSLDTTWVIKKHKEIYDDKPMFLEARGIHPLTTRHNLEKFLFRDNVNRLLSIIEDSNINQNDKLYLNTRQSIENLERNIYDSKKSGELAYAKAFVETRIKNYQSAMESYNQMLAEFRAESDFFMERIEAEKAELDKYKTEIENYKITGQIDNIKLQNYLAQIKIVESTIRSYESAMSVDEAVANLTLSIAELEKINTDAFVLKTDAVVRGTEASLYRKETLLKKLSLMDADYAKEKLGIEESIAQLDKSTREVQHLIGYEQLKSDVELINILKTKTIGKAKAYNQIAQDSLTSTFYGAEDKLRRQNIKLDSAESNAVKLEAELNSKINIANPTNYNLEKMSEKDNLDTYVQEVRGWSDIHNAEIDAAEILRRASMINTLEHFFTEK